MELAKSEDKPMRKLQVKVIKTAKKCGHSSHIVTPRWWLGKQVLAIIYSPLPDHQQAPPQ